MADLLPCPFCGGADRLEVFDCIGAPNIRCANCDVHGPPGYKDGPHAAWNARAAYRWKREATAVLADIADKKQLDADLEKRLADAIADFKKKF